MLQKLLDAVLHPINSTFIVIMVVLALLEIKTKKDLKSVIISTGVLGTFLGVFLGLLDFDTHNLRLSIEHILEGLKTAFLTSVVGMSLAILLSIIEKFSKNMDFDKTDVTILEDISIKLNELYEIKDKIVEFENKYQNNTNILRTLLSTNFKQLNQSLSTAIEHLSKGATEEIIKALENVIKDFNQQLQDQFGENFKHLNEAVKDLLNWQENYKEHVQTTENALQTAIQGLDESLKNFKEIYNYQAQLNIIYKELQDIIVTNKNQIDELSRHLQTYKELSERSKNFFENLEKVNTKFHELTETIYSNTSKQEEIIRDFIVHSTNDITELMKKSQNELELIISHFKQIEQEIPNALKVSLENLNNGLATLTRKFKEDYERIINSYKSNIDQR